MRKAFFKKILILLLVFASVLMQLTSCIKGRFEYMHDKSEIKCIEIVDATYDYYEDRPVQHLIYPIDNIQEFLNELDRITTTFYIIGGYPVGIDTNTLAVKISYNNGDYEVFDSARKSLYYADSDYYDLYRGCDRFDYSKFDDLLTKYIERVENPTFNYMHDKSLISSIEIAKLHPEDKDLQETIAIIEDMEDFYSSLDSIPYVHDMEYHDPIDDDSIFIKINYVNGDYEMFTHCLRESYTKEFNKNDVYVYIGNFEETAFNALMQKYIDMNNH